MEKPEPHVIPCASLLTEISIELLCGRQAKIPSDGFPFNGLRDYVDRGRGDLFCWDIITQVSVWKALVHGFKAAMDHYADVR